MTLKNFTVGQTAYGLDYNRASAYTTYKVRPYTVTAIGRKYLKAALAVSGKPEEFMVNNEDEPYLTQNQNWGYPTYLFPTVQAAMDYVETKEMTDWLRYIGSNIRSADSPYSLEQLRAVREILDPQSHEISFVNTLTVGHTVFIAEQTQRDGNPGWNLTEKNIGSVDATTGIVGYYQKDKHITFRRVSADDKYLTESNPTGQPKLMFVSIKDAAEYIDGITKKGNTDE